MGTRKNQGQWQKKLKAKWRLMTSLTVHNDHPKLELLGAWEPPCRHCTLSFGERDSSRYFVSHKDKIDS